jgi:hypothetical protein
MPKKYIVFAVIALIAVVLVIRVIPRHGIIDLGLLPSGSTNVVEQLPRDTQRILNSMREKGFTRLIRTTNYPPITDREIAQWKWYDYIKEIDPDFDWKMPIEFYGQVIDIDTEKPISGATASLVWSSMRGSPSRTLVTDALGKFSIHNIQGNGVSIDVYCEGYHSGEEARGDYDYADFSLSTFHTPDSNSPVIFRLKKRGASEPMYLWHVTRDITMDGQLVWFDLAKRRVSETGDFAISSKRVGPDRSAGSDFDVTFLAAPNAGLIQSEEEFMFEAPAQGYTSICAFEQRAADREFRCYIRPNFYLRTVKGAYAKIIAQVVQYNPPSAGIQLHIYYNPSGSRNLEYDDKLRIDDR